MPFPLIPVLIGSSFGFAAGHLITRKKKPEGLTPERQKIYEAALINLKDANKLDKLADAFHGEGLVEQSNLLKKRAVLRRLTPEQKKENSAKFKHAISLKDPEQVLKFAAEFEEKGCTGAAFNLRRYAKGLER